MGDIAFLVYYYNMQLWRNWVQSDILIILDAFAFTKLDFFSFFHSNTKLFNHTINYASLVFAHISKFEIWVWYNFWVGRIHVYYILIYPTVHFSRTHVALGDLGPWCRLDLGSGSNFKPAPNCSPRLHSDSYRVFHFYSINHILIFMKKCPAELCVEFCSQIQTIENRLSDGNFYRYSSVNLYLFQTDMFKNM